MKSERPLNKASKKSKLDVFKFVHEVSELIEFRTSSMIPSAELFASVRGMEKEHPELTLPAELIHKSLSIEDRVLQKM